MKVRKDDVVRKVTLEKSVERRNEKNVDKSKSQKEKLLSLSQRLHRLARSCVNSGPSRGRNSFLIMNMSCGDFPCLYTPQFRGFVKIGTNEEYGG